MERYKAVVTTKVPSWRRGAPQLWFHEDYKLIENVLLPLAADTVHVDMLLILCIGLPSTSSSEPDVRGVIPTSARRRSLMLLAAFSDGVPLRKPYQLNDLDAALKTSISKSAAEGGAKSTPLVD